MLCECLMNGIYTMSCYVNVVCLGKKKQHLGVVESFGKFVQYTKAGTKMRKNKFYKFIWPIR